MADNHAQMVMAGLWAKWKSPTSGEEVLSCAILTFELNNAMGELHDRMPVILAEIDWAEVVRRTTGKRAGITGITQTMPGRGIEDLAGRQDGRQRKKQWTSANLASSEQGRSPRIN